MDTRKQTSAGEQLPKLKVVLYQPEIPQNTGNIGRLCVATGCSLDLIHPMGFELSEKNLRRAGLDYWQHLSCHEYASWESWLEQNPHIKPAFLSKRATNGLRSISSKQYDALVFGSESKGLPADLLTAHDSHCFKIPIWDNRVRSYNLANAVAMTVMHMRLS